MGIDTCRRPKGMYVYLVVVGACGESHSERDLLWRWGRALNEVSVGTVFSQGPTKFRVKELLTSSVHIILEQEFD